MDRYNPETKDDVQNALKRIFGPIFEAMLQGEMTAHLGHESNNHDFRETQNRRNGYGNKVLKTTYGEITINVRFFNFFTFISFYLFSFYFFILRVN